MNCVYNVDEQMSRQLIDDEVQEISEGCNTDQARRSRAWVFTWNNPPVNFDL
jgi:hypothetical protein